MLTVLLVAYAVTAVAVFMTGVRTWIGAPRLLSLRSVLEYLIAAAIWPVMLAGWLLVALMLLIYFAYGRPPDHEAPDAGEWHADGCVYSGEPHPDTCCGGC